VRLDNAASRARRDAKAVVAAGRVERVPSLADYLKSDEHREAVANDAT